MTIISIETRMHKCHQCKGSGWLLLKEYHNQYRRCHCYICRGKGEIEKVHQFDVTAHVQRLMAAAGITSLESSNQ